jgi:hypothetical protein
MLPEETDTPKVRAEKKEKLSKLLEIKTVELSQLVSDAAEVAETPIHGPARREVRCADSESLMTGRRRSSLRPRLPQSGSLNETKGEFTPASHRNARESLSRAWLFKQRHDTPGTVTGTSTPRRTSLTSLTTNTPGVYIPHVKERMVDVTGTELAEDMAGNLVAGIFAASEPYSLTGSEEKGNALDNNGMNAPCTLQNTVQESPIENHSPSTDSKSIYQIPYGIEKNNARQSFLMRFQECCLYGRASCSRKHVAILLGGPIDKEPREIIVMSLGQDIRVSQVFSVQKSRRYFPHSIPYNVNFFDLTETAKGEPVLLVSCALELIDLVTQEETEEAKLRVLVGGKESVAVESEQPIIFVEAFGENQVVVTGSYLDDGARMMKFDPMWQSFSWGPERAFEGLHVDGDPVVTHISKILVRADSVETPTRNPIKAVLASDATNIDLVYTFGEHHGPSLQEVENAEVFVDGNSWRWFLVHRKAVAS